MNPTEIDRQHRMLALLWGALLGGVLLLAAVAWGLATGRLTDRPWTPVLDGGLARALLALPLLLMVAGVMVRRTDPTSGGGDAVRGYRTRVVLAAALQEGGGMLGIVVSLLAGAPTWILMMAGLATFAMVRSRPRSGELERLRQG